MDTLKAKIEELLYTGAKDFEIAKVLKHDIRHYFETLEETFATSGGKDFLVKHTRRIDNLLKLVYKIALREMFGDYHPMKNAVPLALVALGSYGREQLCVYSDIDLMLVYKKIPGYNIEQLIEKILYILWDAGLKLGHRVHTVEELFDVSRTDITIKTALLESRFIDGSHFIWTETQNALDRIRHDDVEGYLRYRLEEQDRLHRKYPLTMQPDLKSGAGGFRDANLVFWIGKVLYNVPTIKHLPESIVEEHHYKPFRIALEFLFRVRSALHLVARKKEDRLRLEYIPPVAKLLGFEENKHGHIKLAKKVTESLKVIRLYTTIWSEALIREYMQPPSPKRFIYPKHQKAEYNTLLKQLVKEAHTPYRAHPTMLKALISAKRPERPDDALYATIAKIFYQPHAYSILGTLSFTRLLRYTIPPIKKVVDLPQFDGYHQFAVDIHSLRSLYHLEHIDDAFLASLFEKLNKDEKAMLKIVVFLHDAGKGRKKDHHLVGASLFKIFAAKLGMKPELIEAGERLIMYHTLMSNVAQREDIYNEKIIFGFAAHFPSAVLLDMIYLLTYADMKGVGGDVYNSFTAKLIRTLYDHAREALESKAMLDEAAKRAKKEQALKRHPMFTQLKRSEQNKILRMPSNLLFLRYPPQRILEIAKRAFETDTYSFEISNKNYLTIEIIRAIPLNLGYLLGKLHTLEVVQMDISKLFDEKKYFKIDFATKVDEEDLALIQQAICEAFEPERHYRIPKPHIAPNELDIDCDHSPTYAAMHLRTRNQKGLLAYVIRRFDEMGIDIVTAKVHTIKNRARDMFLIEKNENFCHNTDNIIKALATTTSQT